MNESEKNAVTEMTAKKIIEKNYCHDFKNGTSVKFHYAIEITNFSIQDFREILTFIAANARSFYLYVAEKINNKP